MNRVLSSRRKSLGKCTLQLQEQKTGSTTRHKHFNLTTKGPIYMFIISSFNSFPSFAPQPPPHVAPIQHPGSETITPPQEKTPSIGTGLIHPHHYLRTDTVRLRRMKTKKPRLLIHTLATTDLKLKNPPVHSHRHVAFELPNDEKRSIVRRNKGAILGHSIVSDMVHFL